MNMPQIRKKIRDIGSMELCGSMDLGMKLHHKNDPCHAVKSAGIHARWHLPLVRLAIILLIAVGALCTLCAVKHACCDSNCRDD